MLNIKCVFAISTRDDIEYLQSIIKDFRKCKKILDPALWTKECYRVEPKKSDIIGIGVIRPKIFYFGGIPLAKYALPSSMALVENTVKYFDKYDAVLMENHGFVVASKTIEDAYMKLELAEFYAQVVVNTKILGGAKLLSDEDTQKIINLR